MKEKEVNPFRKLPGEGVLTGDEKWLGFEFNCIKGKAGEALEVLHRLGYRRYILDSPIKDVSARWQEIINGNTGDVEWIGTHVSGICLEGQQPVIVNAIFDIGAIEQGNDRYLNKIYFWNPSKTERIGDWKVEGLDYY